MMLAIGGAMPAAADYGNSKGNVQLYQHINGAPWLVIVDEVDTATGGAAGTGTVVTVSNEFQPVGPAAKAKLSTTDLFGFSAPGVSFNVTVTPMHQ